jgi:hypothetical protein
VPLSSLHYLDVYGAVLFDKLLYNLFNFVPEHSAFAILRENVRRGHEPPHGPDLDRLPKSPSHEQRLQEGQHRRRNRQLGPDLIELLFISSPMHFQPSLLFASKAGTSRRREPVGGHLA